MSSKRMALLTVLPDMFFPPLSSGWVLKPGEDRAPENRCEYIHVRLLYAILGYEHFRQPYPLRAF